MKYLAWMLVFAFCFSLFAQEEKSVDSLSEHGSLKAAARFFAEGKYRATVDELNSAEKALEGSNNLAQLGLIAYWKGITYNRLQDFPEAIAAFDKALSLNYTPVDLHYEYGQALFAAEKMPEARIQFRESLKKKFKRAVSLYYIAFISRELGDKKKAFTFFRAIDKLGPAEAMEVKQAAEMQIGDIYLEQVEKQKNAFREVENYVIPQYEKALAVDVKSNLAEKIKEKIMNLQRKYDLILFNLRNGRPALNPPYFIRVSQELGLDSNVTFAPAETTIAKSDQASTFSKTDFIGRYTVYYRNYLSISPEFRFNYTRYLNRIPEIYKNDNYLLAPAIRTAYEHTLWGKPASHLFDYDYTEARRDVNAEESLDFSSRSHTLMLGERFNFFGSGETIMRLRQRIFQSYVSTQDQNTTSFVVEQIKSMEKNTLLFYFSYDRTRVDDSLFDTNAMTLRTDFIMSRVRNWFTPSFGLGLTRTDPINNKAARGIEYLVNPTVRLSKTFGKNWRGNLKYDYQKNDSKDKTSFAYKKSITSVEFEYLF